MLHLSDLNFNYPDELVALSPKARGDSRILLVPRRGDSFEELTWDRFSHFFKEGDVLILNDSKVIKARLLFKKSTGGQAEVLFVGFKDGNAGLWQVMTRGLNIQLGKEIELPGGWKAKVVSEGRISIIEILSQPTVEDVTSYFEKHGDIPLPPYIVNLRKTREADSSQDEMRYQTVWADRPGSVAAPTSGLHFTEDFLKSLRDKGVQIGYVTLHVGAGTFLPLDTENIEDFQIHPEIVIVPQKTCDLVLQAQAKGRRIWACGTTVTRALESAAQWAPGQRIPMVRPFMGETKLFIYPGYKFKVVTGLLTNFHQPQTSLLALVAAFASLDAPESESQKKLNIEKILKAYQFAMSQKFHLFSYGDLTVMV